MIPALSTYNVGPFSMQARFNLSAVDVKDRSPAQITFVNGFNNQESQLQFVLPVAPCDRLGPGLKIDDGMLDDWADADAIHSGPLVRMFTRPAIQRQQLEYSDHQATICTGWADANLYLAFHFSDKVDPSTTAGRNFVDYQFGRAWGEDLCELLIQPIQDDGSLGPLLHIVCKPSAGQWVQRKRTEGWKRSVGVGRRLGHPLRRPDGGRLERGAGDSVESDHRPECRCTEAAAVQPEPARPFVRAERQLGRSSRFRKG